MTVCFLQLFMFSSVGSREKSFGGEAFCSCSAGGADTPGFDMSAIGKGTPFLGPPPTQRRSARTSTCPHQEAISAPPVGAITPCRRQYQPESQPSARPPRPQVKRYDGGTPIAGRTGVAPSNSFRHRSESLLPRRSRQAERIRRPRKDRIY